MTAQILFVSKPVVPPFNDGSKCLVRDLSGALTRYKPHIMVPRDAAIIGNRRELAPVYARKGGYSPALADNLRVLYWLLLRAREDLWNFVFAPNARTSQIGSVLRRLRRVPVVQTVASPPRSFADPARLLFGDVVVTQSTWTKREFVRAYEAAGSVNVPRIEVVGPCVPRIDQPSRERCAAARLHCGIDAQVPIIMYPGDLEVSHGAAWVAAAIAPVLSQLPHAVIVFAYRHKSPHAVARAKSLESALSSTQVRFVAELPDMHALLATTSVLWFPVRQSLRQSRFADRRARSDASGRASGDTGPRSTG